MVRHTILIIDESSEHRDILARLLSSSGYRVVESAPSDAYEHVSKARPDLIICSLSFPYYRTKEIVHRLRNLPGITTVPVLGMTVYTTLIKRSLAQAIGCVDYVEKPFDLDAVIDHVRTLLSTPMMMA